MKKPTTTELPDLGVRYAATWVCPTMGVLKYITLDALAVKELMHQLSDSVLNTTEAVQVYMVLELKGSKNIIKLDKKTYSK